MLHDASAHLERISLYSAASARWSGEGRWRGSPCALSSSRAGAGFGAGRRGARARHDGVPGGPPPGHAARAAERGRVLAARRLRQIRRQRAVGDGPRLAPAQRLVRPHRHQARFTRSARLASTPGPAAPSACQAGKPGPCWGLLPAIARCLLLLLLARARALWHALSLTGPGPPGLCGRGATLVNRSCQPPNPKP
jgi:hypothetical protein